MTIPLRGYIFFGSSVNLLNSVKDTVLPAHVDAHGKRSFVLSAGAILEEGKEEDDDDDEEASSRAGDPAFEEEGDDADGDDTGASAPLLRPSPAATIEEEGARPYARTRSDPRMVPPPFASLATTTAAGAALAAGGATSASALAVGRQSSAGSSVSSSSYQHANRPGHSGLSASLSARLRPRSRRNSEVDGSGGGGGVQPGSIRASSLMTPVYNRGGAWIEYAQNGATPVAAGGGGGLAGDVEMGGGGGGGGEVSDDGGDGGERREQEEEEEELQDLLGAMDAAADGGPAGGDLGHVPLLMTRSRSSRSRRSDASSSNLSACVWTILLLSMCCFTM